MSHADDDRDLQPTTAEGYKITSKKTIDEYAQLDANDESLNRWKASLGIGNGPAFYREGPNVEVESLHLESASLPAGKKIVFDLKNTQFMEGLKKNPITIKEGVDYTVGIKFRVNKTITTGVRYIQVVKRAGMKVDKMEQMIGSYSPQLDSYTKTFDSEESPSGMIARSGSYNVRSRVVDDDGEVYADFEWSFKLGKEW